MPANVLEAQNLAVGFQSSPLLSPVNLTISGGEIVVLAGPNGAGKSTLVKAFARQLKPLAGTVSLDGHDLWQLRPAEFAAKVAYVPQSLEPAQDMTVEELVALGRYPHQKWWQWYSTGQDESALETALTATELVPLRRKYISQLSGGERQRA
ncbi:MAG: ABC transporter ATP-binding protein, partial [Terriglobales bacterium]